jgi:hypothetical protein
MQNVGELGSVTDREFVNVDSSSVRPMGRWSRLDNLRRFLCDFRVFFDTLDTHHSELESRIATDKEEHVVGDVEGEREGEASQGSVNMLSGSK